MHLDVFHVSHVQQRQTCLDSRQSVDVSRQNVRPAFRFATRQLVFDVSLDSSVKLVNTYKALVEKTLAGVIEELANLENNCINILN